MCSVERRYSEGGMSGQRPNPPTVWVRKRRSERLAMNVPIVVHRALNDGPPFYEGTHTLVVSAHGALLALAANVAPEQRLMLQNIMSGEEQECRVVLAEKKLTGPKQVAVEFKRPAPSFWHIAFPPPDWAPYR